MSITKDTPVDELYYSDEELIHRLVIGNPRDDHKYIKREWKNGRWQYTYQEDLNPKKARLQTPKEKKIEPSSIKQLTSEQHARLTVNKGKARLQAPKEKRIEPSSIKQLSPEQRARLTVNKGKQYIENWIKQFKSR